MPSQKEFMIGCLIGGILGAVGVAVSANYGDQIESLLPNHKKKRTSSKSNHTQSTHHAHAASKHSHAKKTHPKKPLKHKAH